MFEKLFKSKPDTKTVHCEVTGNETSLEKTKVLTKIKGVINLRAFQNPQVDYSDKLIYSSGKPPMKYFSKLHVPSDLYGVLGDLFSVVDDEDDPDQSTALISDRGLDLFMGRQLLKLVDYLKSYELIQFPETMFWVAADEPSEFDVRTKTCDNWGVQYISVGKKYMYKKILKSKSERQVFGYPGILLPPYDVAVGDCAEKNPNGTGYMFQTDRNFTPINLCCNESAVDYCKKQNVLVYYNDFMNSGKLRLLTEHTVSINTNLQNDYKFRSSNI
jgi:hypothetical protein